MSTKEFSSSSLKFREESNSKCSSTKQSSKEPAEENQLLSSNPSKPRGPRFSLPFKMSFVKKSKRTGKGLGNRTSFKEEAKSKAKEETSSFYDETTSLPLNPLSSNADLVIGKKIGISFRWPFRKKSKRTSNVSFYQLSSDKVEDEAGQSLKDEPRDEPMDEGHDGLSVTTFTDDPSTNSQMSIEIEEMDQKGMTATEKLSCEELSENESPTFIEEEIAQILNEMLDLLMKEMDDETDVLNKLKVKLPEQTAIQSNDEGNISVQFPPIERAISLFKTVDYTFQPDQTLVVPRNPPEKPKRNIEKSRQGISEMSSLNQVEKEASTSADCEATPRQEKKDFQEKSFVLLLEQTKAIQRMAMVEALQAPNLADARTLAFALFIWMTLSSFLLFAK